MLDSYTGHHFVFISGLWGISHACFIHWSSFCIHVRFMRHFSCLIHTLVIILYSYPVYGAFLMLASYTGHHFVFMSGLWGVSHA